MAERSRSPSLEPPGRKVEMEDAGAHSLENSSEDEFSDAREAIASPTRPITRVERVDNNPAHGEVPGSEAYEKRQEDARPDEIAIRTDTSGGDAGDNMGAPPAGSTSSWDASSAVPRTVVTRVDSTPAHGEVAGTKAAAMRTADAQPDLVEREGDVSSKHMRLQEQLSTPDPRERSKSPIAADGGFGPMEEEAEEEAGDGSTGQQQSSTLSREEEAVAEGDFGGDFGDDFDDFAEGEDGGDGDDFGDFGEAFDTEETQATATPVTSTTATAAPAALAFPLLNFSGETPSVKRLEELLSPHMNALFPGMEGARASEPATSLPEGGSAFLSDRSHSLWQQLISPPPLQPPNWVRSRIRRLFLVSLGVPVDLDEILPKSKQKKLILPYNASDQNKAVGKAKDTKGSTSTGKEQPSKRMRGPPPPPDFDTEEVERLCKKSSADLEEMSDTALEAHVKRLEVLAEVGKAVLHYWIKRKESAVDEKEAFDSVVESLVRHARRVRQ